MIQEIITKSITKNEYYFKDQHICTELLDNKRVWTFNDQCNLILHGFGMNCIHEYESFYKRLSQEDKVKDENNQNVAIEEGQSSNE